MFYVYDHEKSCIVVYDRYGDREKAVRLLKKNEAVTISDAESRAPRSEFVHASDGLLDELRAFPRLITEKMLLDNFKGITYSGGYASDLFGHKYVWRYSKRAGVMNPLCDRSEATDITPIECESEIRSKYCSIRMEKTNDDHPAIEAIRHEEEKYRIDA